jgi:hypothetical protein
MESKNWRPSKWKEEAIRRRVARVYRIAVRELAYLLGPHLAGVISAQLVAEIKSSQSCAELRRRGIPMIGDRRP